MPAGLCIHSMKFKLQIYQRLSNESDGSYDLDVAWECDFQDRRS